MSNNQQQQQMPRPNTDLDFQQQLTDPFVSSPYVAPAFSNKFKEFEFARDEKGDKITDENGQYVIYVKRDLWNILQMFTRDWRLGNIDTKREAVYIRHYINLSADIMVTLGDDFREPALISLQRALAVNETSQSKGGFVRKILNTFIHKTTPNQDEKNGNSRNLFGLGKKQNKE